MEKLKRFAKFLIENKLLRAVILLVALLSGIPFVNEFGGWLICFLGAHNAEYYVRLPLLTLPLLFVLWFFRTYDTRQQIAKSEAQTHESRFTNGLNKLLSEKSLHISMGVKLLTRLSHQTDGKLDDEIRLAFIKRFQHLPDSIRYHNGNKVPSGKQISLKWPTLNYIPHMLQWILDHPKKNKINFDKKSIDVPEMYFEIEEMDSTKRFTDELTPVCDKKIWLSDIQTTLNELRSTTSKGCGAKIADLDKFTFTPCKCAVNMHLARHDARLIHKLTGESCKNQTGDSRRYNLGVCEDWQDALQKAKLKLTEHGIRNGEVKPCGSCERVAHARHEWLHL